MKVLSLSGFSDHLCKEKVSLWADERAEGLKIEERHG